jgi:hypothetical protein
MEAIVGLVASISTALRALHSGGNWEPSFLGEVANPLYLDHRQDVMQDFIDRLRLEREDLHDDINGMEFLEENLRVGDFGCEYG